MEQWEQNRHKTSEHAGANTLPLHGSERGAISLLAGGFYSVYRVPRGTDSRCATSTKSLLLIKVENFAGVFFSD